VGGGSADLPRALVSEARRLGRAAHVTAIDRDPTALASAARLRDGSLAVVRADARRLPFETRAFDVVTASLVLHHFPSRELVPVLVGLLAVARQAVVVNDLRRSRVHRLLVRALGTLARRGPLFRHDGPLSVERAFVEGELEDAARRAGARSVEVRRSWPYRLVMVAGAGGAR
jgi:trans-aconitate methyltransferase